MAFNAEVAISTSDNPYNPLTDYDNWEAYDHRMGYNTSEYLARIVKTTSEYGTETYTQDIEKAIDEIVLLNLISWTNEDVSYIKVTGEVNEEQDSTK